MDFLANSFFDRDFNGCYGDDILKNDQFEIVIVICDRYNVIYSSRIFSKLFSV